MGLSHSSTGLALERVTGLWTLWHRGYATLNHFALTGSNGTETLQSSRRRLRMQTSSWLPSSAKALMIVTACQLP